MNAHLYWRFLPIIMGLLAVMTACSSSESSVSETEAASVPTTGDLHGENTPQDEQRDEAIASSAVSVAECITWQQYKDGAARSRFLPNMPSGFEDGCMFGTNLENESQRRLYILRDGISLDRVFDEAVLATAPQEQGVLNLENDAVTNPSGFAHELITGGNAMIVNVADPRTCEVAGELQPSGYYSGDLEHCGFASPYRTYTIFDEQRSTACFRDTCLETYADIPGEELLSSWSPWQVPTPYSDVNTVRSQYDTIDLNTLPNELRGANFRSQIETVLMEEFGRETLGEGEQPTVISQDENYGDTYGGLNVMTVTNEGLADDSVGGYRYRFEFESFDGDTWLLVWAGSQQYCWRSDEWTNQLCP